ncbi:hypothetical protein D3C74_250180 [compost metagenome]
MAMRIIPAKLGVDDITRGIKSTPFTSQGRVVQLDAGIEVGDDDACPVDAHVPNLGGIDLSDIPFDAARRDGGGVLACTVQR